MNMTAFHNQQEVKDKYLARVRHHRELDNLIQGQGWENGKGCAIGCTLEAYDHSRYPMELGLPEWLARLEDTIFEGLPVGRAKQWPAQFLSAIRPGADCELARVPFVVFILEQNLATLDSLKVDAEKWPQVAAAIEQSKAATKQMIAAQNGEGDLTAARSAESAARSAWSAAKSAGSAALSAARSAAWLAALSAAKSAGSAESAAKSAARSAESAAWSAARSAESAAESAAWSAESAAWSAAESAARSARSAARSAESAAWSAAWSAESAAWSAAESAARSARSAARSARSAAESAAYEKYADKLLEILRSL